jgi:hypothetical protein
MLLGFIACGNENINIQNINTFKKDSSFSNKEILKSKVQDSIFPIEGKYIFSSSTPIIMRGPVIINSPNLIKLNKVKSLFITNCLNNSECYKDYYSFDNQGRIVKEIHPMVSSFYKFKYEEFNRVKIQFEINKSSNKITSKYIYNYLDTDSVLIEYRNFDNNSNNKKRVYKIKNDINKIPNNCIQNNKGQIIQHSYGYFSYACGNEFYGNYTVKYKYDLKGLISEVCIYNDKNENVVSLTYDYRK